jgi:hypothetical protein
VPAHRVRLSESPIVSAYPSRRSYVAAFRVRLSPACRRRPACHSAVVGGHPATVIPLGTKQLSVSLQVAGTPPLWWASLWWAGTLRIAPDTSRARAVPHARLRVRRGCCRAACAISESGNLGKLKDSEIALFD